MAMRPKRWDLFNQAMMDDTPMPHILTLMQDLASRPIILCTGREETFRETTESWLRQHLVHFEALYMRPEKDYRPDYVVKAELLKRILNDGFEPVIVVDQRRDFRDDHAEGFGVGRRTLQQAPRRGQRRGGVAERQADATRAVVDAQDTHAASIIRR